MTPEIHLFLIWERGQYEKAAIIKDIQKYFRIIIIQNIKWDKDNFSRNISRFYGTNLPPHSFKEEECGTEALTVIVVRDDSPTYDLRQTSVGIQTVNTKVFDAKNLYRRWTGGGHKIHATNTTEETRKDVLLLTGKAYEYYLNAPEIWSGSIPQNVVERNLPGCIQWSSLSELFSILNETTEYVVLRNFDGFPETYYADLHGDIDLLVKDRQKAVYLCNATPVFHEKYRVHYKVNINNQTVRFDLRSVGDGYYDERWENDILKRRQLQNSFYIPSPEDYKFSLLYHALVHKDIIADDYATKFQQFGLSENRYYDELKMFMAANGYRFTEPNDFSVYFNAKRIGCSLSTKRKWTKFVFLCQRIKTRITNDGRNAYKTDALKLRALAKKILKPIYRKIFPSVTKESMFIL